MLFAYLVAAAASLTPSQDAIRVLAAQDMRVAAIGYRLARAGIAAESNIGCAGSFISIPGLVIQNAAQYQPASREDARVALRLGDGPTITGIVPDSAADRAKLRAGDHIVSVNGNAVGTPAGKGDSYTATKRVEDLIEAGMKLGGATIAFTRDGKAEEAYLASQSGCASRFQLVPGTALNAEADGQYVQISGAMVEFARDDDELATIIAHELAHNILRHRALETPSRQAEYEADRLSVWLLARAGYALDAIVPFWSRLGRKTDYGIFSDLTHPGWRKRVARMTRAIGEVRAQKAAGQAIVFSAQQSPSQRENRR